MADRTFLLKNKIYLSIYLSMGIMGELNERLKDGEIGAICPGLHVPFKERFTDSIVQCNMQANM